VTFVGLPVPYFPVTQCVTRHMETGLCEHVSAVFQARYKHVKIRNFENVLLLQGNVKRFYMSGLFNYRRFVCRFDAF